MYLLQVASKQFNQPRIESLCCSSYGDELIALAKELNYFIDVQSYEASMGGDEILDAADVKAMIPLAIRTVIGESWSDYLNFTSRFMVLKIPELISELKEI